MTELPEGFGSGNMQELIDAVRLDARRECMPQVDALLLADWSFELPEIVNGSPVGYDTEPWQWYWRSPAKPGHKKGRRYQSTAQAFNALQKLFPQ